MKNFAKIILLLVLLSPLKLSAQHIQACITVTGPGTWNNSVWPREFIKCRWDTISLWGTNCQSPLPGDYNATYVDYQWKNLSNTGLPTTFTPDRTNIIDSGKWELTIRYNYPTTGAQIDRDTVHVKWIGASFNITTVAPDPSIIKVASGWLLNKCPNDTVTFFAPTGANYSNYKWYETTSSRTYLGNGTSYDVKPFAGAFKRYLGTAFDNVSGCIVGEQILVQNKAAPNIELGADQNICTGGNTTLQSSVSPGGSTYTYQWSTGATTTNITVNSTAKYWLAIKEIGATGCRSVDSVQVTIRAYPDFSFTDVDMCFATASVNISPNVVALDLPATYSWAASADLSPLNAATTTASPTTAGPHSYSLTITSAYGCGTTKAASVNKYPQLNSSVGFTSTSICRNTDITLVGNTATGGVPGSGPAYEYEWKKGTNTISNSQNALVSPNTDATYQFIVTDDVDCSVSIDVTVAVTGPTVSLGADKFGDGVNPVVLNPTTTGTVTAYDWFNEGNATSLGTASTLSTTTTGNYVVVVTDGTCFDKDTVTVTMIDGSITTLYVPSAFSPESVDEENKVIKVYGPAIATSDFSFKIYNRWGDLVYFTNNLSEAQSQGWTGPGSSADKNQQNVFTYSVSGKFLNGEEFAKTGTITLVR